MASNIVLKTFAAGDDGQGTVTPQDDALIYQNAIPMNGIFSGAAVTLSEANVLHVAAGFGIIGGRFFEINESDVTVELSSSGTLLGRLYIHLELTNADVPISINVATGASLPDLVGDPDLNINDGAFDLELATFNVSEVTISDIVNTFPTISKANNQLRRATAYSINDMVLCQSASDSLIFICTTAGTTAVQEPTAYATVTDGNTVTDGTAVFKAVSVSGQITKLSKTEVLISNSGDAYDPTRPYKIGDLCIYNNVLYRCTTACSAGSWATNQSCFTSSSLTEAFNDLTDDFRESGLYATQQGIKIGKLGNINGKNVYRYVVTKTTENLVSEYSFSLPFNASKILSMSAVTYRVLSNNARQYFSVPCSLDANTRFLLYASGSTATLQSINATFGAATLIIYYEGE